MNHENVDVIRFEAPERSIDLIENRTPREAALVHVVARILQSRFKETGNRRWILFVDEKADFGDEDEFVARNLILSANDQRKDLPIQPKGQTHLDDKFTDD